MLLSISIAPAGVVKYTAGAAYNIRYNNKSGTLNAWAKRLPVIADLVRFYYFKLFRTQEVQHHQLQDMAKALPVQGYLGAGRDDGK